MTTTPLTTHTSQTRILLRFVGWEFWRNFRMADATFFVIVLPAAMYLMFGVAMDQGDMPAGFGNVSAYVMTSMAVYGAVISTTAMAGSAAVERTMGWGRQLNLTGLTETSYILGKMLMALLMAIAPILIVYVVGALTGAAFDSLWHWIVSGLLCLAVAIPFSLYGLAFALLFRSETAVSAASGLLVLFAFFGNLFIPLGGVLLDIAKFTPLYGPAMLARWPQTEGMLIPMDAGAQVDFEAMWVLLVNLGTWTALFGLLCLIALRRRTAR